LVFNALAPLAIHLLAGLEVKRDDLSLFSIRPSLAIFQALIYTFRRFGALQVNFLSFLWCVMPDSIEKACRDVKREISEMLMLPPQR